MNRRFWTHWVLANGLGEVIGLGIVAFIGWVYLTVSGPPQGPGLVLAFAGITVGLGAIEGAVVGYAQALVLRERLPLLHGWVGATVVGALVAWSFGMLPSTIMKLRPNAPAAAPPDIPAPARMLMACGLGLVAGPLLAVFQARVLRRHVARSGWWLIANALAWAAGMPVVFAGIHLVVSSPSRFVSALILTGTLFVAGSAVGAIHGLFLVRLTSVRSAAA